MPKDSYGEYQLLTGLEGPRQCFWCGCEVGKRRRYCCEEHQAEYWGHFSWAYAAPRCQQRADNKCADCGGFAGISHHITPLGGETRAFNIKNRPENLAALCHSCHGRRHAAAPIDGRLEKAPPPPQGTVERAIARGQLVLVEV